jgi:TonB family protein
MMSTQRDTEGTVGDGVALTANDRFKRSFGSWLWGSMIVATALHLAVFQLWPVMVAKDVSINADDPTVYNLPPDVDLPPEPDPVQRPASPVVATVDVSEDVTIGRTRFQDNPVSTLPAPPTGIERDTADLPHFTPFTVKPDIKNRVELSRAMEREYPALLRDAGIGGTVTVWFLIDEDGQVARTLINQSSGHQALDEAALRVAELAEFTPALNRDKRVQVWISLPITFTTRW